MTAKARRAKSNSIPELVKKAQAKRIEHDVPVGFDLDEDEMAIYQDYLQHRDDWSVGELRMLARLSQHEVEIRRQTEIMRDEGEVIEHDNGVTSPNPRHKIIVASERAHLQLLGKLHLAGTTAQAESRNRKSMGQRAAPKVSGEKIESLIARPKGLLA